MAFWSEYAERFALVPASLREDCGPQLYEHERAPKHAVVLVHGLTDSPYFMQAIAERFHAHGWNAYLPLLHMHGLREPNGMQGVSYLQWRENVHFALETATRRCEVVSVGGLSTGGTLSVDAAIRDDPRVDGAVFLFAAALDIYRRAGGFDLGNLREWLLRSPVASVLDFATRGRPTIGPNPYRYARVPIVGATELAHLIHEVDRAIAKAGAAAPLHQPVFAAHSLADRSAHVEGVLELLEKIEPERKSEFWIDEAEGVSHAEVVLRETIDVPGGEPEKANPHFEAMIAQALAFADRVLA